MNTKYILALVLFSHTALGVEGDLKMPQVSAAPSGTTITRNITVTTASDGLLFYNIVTDRPECAIMGDGLSYDSLTHSITVGLSTPVTDYINTSLDDLYDLVSSDTTTAISDAAVNYATTTQGGKADTAVQPAGFTWTNLSGKPSFGTVATSNDYVDLSNKPALFSGVYADLTSKPNLFSGSYTDLTNKPTLFSGSYLDLTNKPTLGTSAALDVAASGNATSGQVVKGNDTRLNVIQKLRAQTDASGNYTWTFPTAYGSGVVPIIDVDTETGSSTVAYSASIVSVSNTQVVLKTFSHPTVTLLSILIGAAPIGTQSYIHLKAQTP